MADGKTRFVSVMTPPPTGEFFYEVEGERVTARTWAEMQPKAYALMQKHGIDGPVEWAVAEYMCPYLPAWYCKGERRGRSYTSLRDARNNGIPYFKRPLIAPDEIALRLRACAECQMHARTVCLSCTGTDAWILQGFAGRRTKMLEDKLSGICECHKTFESLIASVDLGESPVPDGLPETCWRCRHDQAES